MTDTDKLLQKLEALKVVFAHAKLPSHTRDAITAKVVAGHEEHKGAIADIDPAEIMPEINDLWGYSALLADADCDMLSPDIALWFHQLSALTSHAPTVVERIRQGRKQKAANARKAGKTAPNLPGPPKAPQKPPTAQQWRAPDDWQWTGADLKRLRRAKGLTQQDFARIVGCHKSYIYSVEKEFVTRRLSDRLQEACAAVAQDAWKRDGKPLWTGNDLAAYRAAKGWTIVELAEKLGVQPPWAHKQERMGDMPLNRVMQRRLKACT